MNPSCMQTEAKRLWKLNEALSLALLSPTASLYVPVAPPSGPQALPHLAWRPDRAFHTGALCAAALDSMTLPYRLHRPSPTSPLGLATGILLGPFHCACILLLCNAVSCQALWAATLCMLRLLKQFV